LLTEICVTEIKDQQLGKERNYVGRAQFLPVRFGVYSVLGIVSSLLFVKY